VTPSSETRVDSISLRLVFSPSRMAGPGYQGTGLMPAAFTR
jgi:hypothetical protein